MLITKSNQIARTIFYPFSQTFCLAYSPLNPATLRCSSEVTITVACYGIKQFQSDLINWFKGFGLIKKFVNSLNDTQTKKEEATISLEDIDKILVSVKTTKLPHQETYLHVVVKVFQIPISVMWLPSLLWLSLKTLECLHNFKYTL